MIEDGTFLEVILRLERGVGGAQSWLRSWGTLNWDKDFVLDNEKLVMFLSWESAVILLLWKGH